MNISDKCYVYNCIRSTERIFLFDIIGKEGKQGFMSGNWISNDKGIMVFVDPNGNPVPVRV